MTESAAFAVVGEFLRTVGGLLDVWAKVKAPASRRRETERRRIQDSLVPSTGFLRTPRLYSCYGAGSMGLIAGRTRINSVGCPSRNWSLQGLKIGIRQSLDRRKQLVVRVHI